MMNNTVESPLVELSFADEEICNIFVSGSQHPVHIKVSRSVCTQKL
jgi:hypothetical protein